MGQGLVEDKSMLLCNFFDEKMEKTISKNTFAEILDIMITVSLRYAPTLITSYQDSDIVST